MFDFIKEAFQDKISFTKEKWNEIQKQYTTMYDYVRKYKSIVEKAERVINLGALEADTEARRLIAKKDLRIAKLEEQLALKETSFSYLVKDYKDLLDKLALAQAGIKIPKPKTSSFRQPSLEISEQEVMYSEEKEEDEKPVVTLTELKERIKNITIDKTVKSFDNYIEKHKVNIHA